MNEPIPTSTEKRPIESKKFCLAVGAIAVFCLVWAASYVGVMMNAAAAPHLVTLATLMSGMLTLVAGAGITGQSFIDLKAQSNINASAAASIDIKREDTNITITQMELDADSDLPNNRV